MVNCAMRSRSSSKPKLMSGSVSATDVGGRGAMERRERLDDREGSNAEAMV